VRKNIYLLDYGKRRTFLERVVVFPPVLATSEREALIRVADQLSVELGHVGDQEIPGEHSRLGGAEGAMAGILNSEDELLVTEIRRGLAKIAAGALDGDEPAGAGERAVCAALDGTELVMRGEIVMGNAGRLPALLPGFVFLVTLPVVDQDRALELSKRASTLVEGAFGQGRS
jgi:hypothetical protein